MPARSEGRVDFEHGVYNVQRIDHKWIVGLSNSIADQLEKSRIHDVLGRKLMLRAWRMVRDSENAMVGIFLRLGVVHALRKNPYVMPPDSRNQRTLRGNCPGFDVRVQKVGVFFQEFRGGFVASFAEKTSGADQRSDVRGKRGRRISACFLPPLLLSDRSMPDKIRSRPRNH